MIVAEYWNQFQPPLFRVLASALEEPLTSKLEQCIRIWDVVRIEDYVRGSSRRQMGRPEHCRRSIARAFVAKCVYNLATTESLLDLLKSNRSLRRLCGFESTRKVPSSATFSRAFDEFAASSLGDRVHLSLVEQHVGDQIVMHGSTDATAVHAREKPVAKVKAERPPKKRRGRPKKGEVRPPIELKRTEKQLAQSGSEGLSELPRSCDIGAKTNSKGNTEYWIGWKTHIYWADGAIPLTAITTSASLQDGQAAIPVLKLTAGRAFVLYDLMDRGYDSDVIRQASRELGHVPLIDFQKRGSTLRVFDPAEADRYKNRTTAERGFSRLKDEFGLRNLRVRGHPKAHMHIMFGVLALFADQLLKPYIS